jgi:LacI family transcriptional regulator
MVSESFSAVNKNFHFFEKILYFPGGLHESSYRLSLAIMVSISDIAREMGVSKATVSRVLNGKAYVNAETREQILKKIAETGYIPNRKQQAASVKPYKSVGIVIPDSFNMYQRQLFTVIERYLSSFGYYTPFFFVKLDGSGESECLKRIKDAELAGIIMIHNVEDRKFYEHLEFAHIPVIATQINPGIPCVRLDDRKAAYDATKHLISIGHTKINLLLGELYDFEAKRLEGCLDALDESGIARDESRIGYVHRYTAEAGKNGMKELMLRSPDFTAVFVVSDDIAMGAMRAMLDQRIRIPDDVSIVGFDNIEMADYTNPRLTTIHQPVQEIGEQAAVRLHHFITGEEKPPLDLILPHRLVIRESTRAPASI